jgi:hypothetical protein
MNYDMRARARLGEKGEVGPERGGNCQQQNNISKLKG